MAYPAIPEQLPIVMQFATAQAALAHKRDNGGWVFISDERSNGIWFDAQVFTQSCIMRHPITRGASGAIY